MSTSCYFQSMQCLYLVFCCYCWYFYLILQLQCNLQRWCQTFSNSVKIKEESEKKKEICSRLLFHLSHSFKKKTCACLGTSSVRANKTRCSGCHVRLSLSSRASLRLHVGWSSPWIWSPPFQNEEQSALVGCRTIPLKTYKHFFQKILFPWVIKQIVKIYKEVTSIVGMVFIE